MAMPNHSEIALTVRLPQTTLDRIDTLVRMRRTKIPRHSWLLEAVYEKLSKEESVEGSLDVFRENHRDSQGTPRYRLLFVRYDGGAPQLAPVMIAGEDALEQRLVSWGFRSEDARQYIEALWNNPSISIPNVMLPAHLVGPHGFKLSASGG